MNDELTDVERQLVHHIEVLGMSPARAAELLNIGSPYAMLQRPRVREAREIIRDNMRQHRVKFTKDDIVDGIKEAIDQAKLIDDPMAQIRGWTEIADLLGYKSKQSGVTINISNDARKQIAALPDNELMRLAGDGDIIDGEFRRVE